MANPYSTPSEYTPRNFNMLEKFGDLAAKKEAEYQASQAAMGKLMADMPTQEGFLTPGLIKEVNSDYTQRILDVQKQLMLNKDVNEAQRNLSKIAAQYQQDNRVLSGARDAERSKTMPLWELENQGSYMGYKNPDGSPIAVDFKTLTPSQIDQYYANTAKAPDWKEEDAMWLHMTPEERTKLSGLQMLPPTETGEIFFWDGTKKQSIRDLSANGNYPTLTAVSNDLYNTKATTASNFYNKSGKGLNSYVTDFFERGRLFNINNTDESKTYRASALNNGSGSGSGGKVEQPPALIQATKSGVGYFSESLFDYSNPQAAKQEIATLENKLANEPDPNKKAIIEKDLNARYVAMASYDQTVEDFHNSSEGKKEIERIYVENKADQNLLDFVDKSITGLQEGATFEGIDIPDAATLTNLLRNGELAKADPNSSSYIGKLRKIVDYAIGDTSNWDYTQNGQTFKNPPKEEVYKNYAASLDKKAAVETAKDKAIKNFASSDIAQEVSQYSYTNMPDEGYKQIAKIATDNALTTFDLGNSDLQQIANGHVNKGYKWDSPETKREHLKSALGDLTDKEKATATFQTQGDGLYLVYTLDRKKDGSIGDENVGYEDDFGLVPNKEGEVGEKQLLRLKVDKENLRQNILTPTTGNGGLALLETLNGYTKITESGSGGFQHGTELQGMPKSILQQIFTPSFNNPKKNYKDEIEKDTPVLDRLYGSEADSNIANAKEIKGRQVKADVGNGIVRNGIRIETDGKPITISDYSNSSIGTAELKLGEQGNPHDNKLLDNFVNSIIMANVKSNGTKTKYGETLDANTIDNIMDEYLKTNMEGVTLADLTMEISKYVLPETLSEAPYTFGSNLDFNDYRYRGSGTGKKQTPQGQANPLGIR